MNPLAVALLVLGVALLPGALALGGHQGLTIAGVALVVAAIIIQTVRPIVRRKP